MPQMGYFEYLQIFLIAAILCSREHCRVMGRPIEYVDCIDLLGVSVTSRSKKRNVNSSVQKFYCRVHSVLYDFKDIPCDVKAKLLDTYRL